MSEAAIVKQRFERARGSCNPPHGGAVTLWAVALLAGAAAGGCASQPPPTAQMVRASTLVSEAEKDQAQRYAPTDLQRARDELNDAQTAESDHKYDQALRLAENAAADANLASARASSSKAQQSAEQVRTSLQTLQQQLQQTPPPPPTNNSGPGNSGPDGPGRNRP